MSHGRFAVWLVLLSCMAIVLMTPLSGSQSSPPGPRLSTASRSIVVTTAAELVAALSADPGDLTIFVQRGTYQLDHAIHVPDNTALIGEGAMLYDSSGLPTGFVSESRTVILALPGVTGDFVTLGDGASLQGLVIQDVTRPALTGGAVVAVSSRMPSDSVSGQVVECEIINPNPSGGAPDGPSGRGLLAITRNPSASGAVTHEQSLVSVTLAQSIVRSSAGGSSVFGINFAGGSHIDMHLRQNVLVGPLNVTGGASRPDSVAGSTLLLQSNGNLYRADSASPASLGWNLQGGTDAPIGGLAAETVNNRLSVHSVDDRIEEFARAIAVNGGRRNSALSAPSSLNEVRLILQGTRLRSTTSDLLFSGAQSAVAGMAAGDNNEVRVTMRDVTGSGPRANAYADATLGAGNRLVMAGSLTAFSKSNQAILPLPGEQFFAAGR